MSAEEEIEDILRRPYQRVLVPDEDRGFTATIQEFPGCIAEGDTPHEAYDNLESVARDWLEGALEQGLAIPLPIAANEYSGRVVVRLPRWLHRRAVEAAHSERVSLNTFLVSSIAERIGEDRTTQRLEQILEGRVKTALTGTMVMYTSVVGTPPDFERGSEVRAASTGVPSLTRGLRPLAALGTYAIAGTGVIGPQTPPKGG